MHAHAPNPGAQITGNRQEAPTARVLVIAVFPIVSTSIYKMQFLTSITATTIAVI